MNAVLDYDVLEMLGAALRESNTVELREPLNEDLLALCRRLKAEDDTFAIPLVGAGRIRESR